MNRKNIPSDRAASLGGGVVRPFSDKRASPNVLYLGDCVNGAIITEISNSDTKQWVHAECEGGIFATTFKAFAGGA